MKPSMQKRNLRRQKTKGLSISVQGKATKPIVTPELVEQRSRELAVIAGRDPHQLVASDLDDARKELLGAIHPTSRRADEATRDTAQWDPTPASTGRRTRKKLPADDQTIKELVEEGVDEAEHNEMLEARKRRTVLNR